MQVINVKSARVLFVIGCAVILASLSSRASAVWEEYDPIGTGNSGDKLGCSVSLSGNRLIVGKEGMDGAGGQYNVGGANIYERQSNGTWEWVQQLSAFDQYDDANFGRSVALSGGRALVGAAGSMDNNETPEIPDPGSDPGLEPSMPKGEAYVFERQTNGSWSQMGEKLTPSDASSSEWDVESFGEAVSISSGFALVSDGSKDSGAGAAYMFSRASDGSWNEIAKLTLDDAAASDNFGSSVSVWGNLALIGADQKNIGGKSSSGAAYIFKSANWSEAAAELVPNNHDPNDLFGTSVSLNGNRALIGARGDSGNIGAAYIFECNEFGQWNQTAKLAPGDGAALDFFGQAVSLSGDRAVVSSKQNDGSVYVYACNSYGVWGLETKLTHPIGQAWFSLGDGTIAIGGASLVVGDMGWSGDGKVYEFGPGRTAVVPVSTTPQTVDVLGGTGSPGGVSATFGAVDDEGTFSADYTTCALEEISGIVGANIPEEYEIPGQTAQLWFVDHSFGGGYLLEYTLTFRISRPDNWYQVPNWDQLVVLHLTDSGEWETLRPTHVDPDLYLLTVKTSSLSPFVLASVQAVPERPTMLLVL